MMAAGVQGFGAPGRGRGSCWAGVTGALVGASLLVGGVAQAAPIKITQGMLPLVISQPGS